MAEPQLISFEVDAPHQLRKAVFSGVITESAILQAYERLVSEPDYDPTLNDLVDISGVERFEVSGRGVREFVAMFARPKLLSASKLAIVAPGDYIFGLARMYQILSEERPKQIQVFRDLKDAEHWLGITPTAQTY